ncbi:hypothetical protein M0R72_01525 [Candidatus Pacearchaeota archaeon]|jgi:hypothetical protein|nr:hypothetical protein [Candidatus Pacearchaeota archaeon]
MANMKYLLISLVLLVSSTCLAESFDAYLRDTQAQAKFGGVKYAPAKPVKYAPAKPKAKPAPTPASETTTNVLDCGVTIEVGSLKHYRALNQLCSDVVVKYRTSFPEYSIPAKVNIPVSFLPSSVLVEHFGGSVEGKSGKVVKLDGFTDIDYSGNPKHFYVLSNWNSLFYFKTVFAHELFHVLNALSHHEDSEKGAAAFTTSLGLGV